MGQAPILDLVAPISDSDPTGINIRNDNSHQELYFRLKDVRNEARNAERSADFNEDPRLSPKWAEVHQLAADALLHTTKDIEILAWLAEAQIRLAGYAGLADVFALMGHLFEDHWPEIHSIGTEDEIKVAPLVGLNGAGGEGTLVQPIRLTALVPGCGFFTHSLWDYQLSLRNNRDALVEGLEAASRSAGEAKMRAHLADILRCGEAFAKMCRILDEKCGREAPPSAHIRAVLNEAAMAVRDLAGIKQEHDADAADPVGAAGGNRALRRSDDRPFAAHGCRLEIETREDAFRTLLAVADYFRHSEPHSPLSHAIETLVRRGRMDFVNLLRELVPEPQARRSVLTAAGIHTEGEDST